MPLLTNEYLNYSPKVPKILYHYCSTHAFLSIIKNSNLWLADASKTNDETELIGLFENISNIIDDILLQYKSIFTEETILQAKICSELVIKNLISGEAPIVKNSKNLLICFSEARDLLSQWRAYSNNGQGLAIGFNSEYLKEFVSSTSYGFTKVIYNKKDSNRLLYKGMCEQLKWSIQDALDEKNHLNAQALLLNLSQVIFSIFQEGFVFKHNSFSEEREWRIMKRFTSSNFDDSDGADDYGYAEFLDGIFRANPDYCSSFSRSELKYRSIEDDIRTYIELGFEKIKSKFIKEIIIGPKCNISELDIKLMLTQFGYIDDIYSDAIKITQSNAPYR